MNEINIELTENIHSNIEPRAEQITKKQKKSSGRLKQFGLGMIFPIGLIVAWEMTVRFGFVESYQLPAPTVLVDELWALTMSGTIWSHIYWTLYRVFGGFLLGTIAAILLSVIVGFSKKAEYLFDPIIQAFRSIPSLAWVPLFILWMGIGESSKITMIAVGVFFPVYLNLVSGILNVDKKLIEVGKMYQLSFIDMVRQIVLPASLPSFLVGIRSGLGLGWMFVVAAELMGASQGLGFMLVLGQNTLSPETILVSIILFAVIGKFTDWLLKLLEKRLLHYQERFA
jgi:sulfonate transport system permease protein